MTTDHDPGPSTVATVTVGPDADGRRVDRFVADSIGTVSRSRVKSMIEAGCLHRNDALVNDPAAPVRAGATYRLSFPPVVAATPGGEAIPLAIRYEDEHLIVLDKQAGLVTHPAPGHEAGTLVNALIAHCGDTLPGIGGERRPGIVHRLDKDTSGLMMVAKTEAALAALSADIAARRVERAYLALAWGIAGAPDGTWTGAIGRDPRDRKRMAVVDRGGKPAMTNWERLADAIAVSLLRFRLETGRTHQIRVHAAAAGHPLVGDPVYLRRRPAGAGDLPQPVRDALLDFPRQALHAAVLGFRHPATGQTLRFAAAPPPDLRKLLDVVALGDAALHHTR